MSIWNWFTRPGRVSREVGEEIQAHIGERTDDLIDAGVPEAEARRRARVELGSAVRAREDSRAVWVSRFVDQAGRDARWAWRGVRARRGRAWLAGGLMALALAANASVFVVVDALVFDRAPYPNAARLVSFNRWLTAPVLEAWRRQADLFTSAEGYFVGTTFVLGEGTAEHLSLINVTPGLFDTLGVAPAWGRAFVEEDGRRVDEQPVIVSAPLARRRFGSPEASLDRIVPTAAQPFRVVGVMPDGFAFPSAEPQIWRVLDPAGPLTRNWAGVMGVARLAPGVSLAAVAQTVRDRAAVVDAAAGVKPSPIAVRRYGVVDAPARGAQPFYILLGAAACLLLIACVNVLNLEMAGTMARTRTFAVQSALGASRASLIRVTLLEGVLIFAISGLAACLLTSLALPAIAAGLPTFTRTLASKPFVLDGRGMAYMLAAGFGAWLLVSLPSAVYASRLDLSRPLKVDDRSTAPRRFGVWLRRAVTVVQLTLAVLLVVVGALFVRTYQHLLEQPKGFDSTNLVSVSMSLPSRFYPSAGSIRRLAAAVAERARAQPGVVDALDGPIPPSTGNTPTVNVRFQIDGQLRESGTGRAFALAVTPVDARYFRMLRVPLRAGRWLAAGDDPTATLIGERFAERFWGTADAALGRVFDVVDSGGAHSLMFGEGPHRIVGVIADYRTRDAAGPYASSVPREEFDAFTAAQPVSAEPAPASPELDTGGSYRIVNVLVRLDSPGRAAAVLAAVKDIEPRIAMSVSSVDQTYADQYRATLLATRVVGAFAVASFLIALLGVYGVMSFLVAGRTREIGIRMALGADRRRIAGLVVGSSLALVLVGAAAGLAAALALSRLIASQLFNVSPSDPATYLAVAAATVATSLLATWQPARRAARIDPVTTLRAE